MANAHHETNQPFIILGDKHDLRWRRLKSLDLCFLSLGRWCVIDGQAIDPDRVVSAIVWSVALCVGGFFFFRAGEDVFGRD